MSKYNRKGNENLNEFENSFYRPKTEKKIKRKKPVRSIDEQLRLAKRGDYHQEDDES